MKKSTSAVLLWGGLWGISEASIGHLAHVLFPGTGWLFFYPIAYGFMRRAYAQTGSPQAVLCCAILSASIKLINLPVAPRPDYVINPAVSIVLEGLAVSFMLRQVHGKARPMVDLCLLPFATSALWRGLYLVYLLLAPVWIKEASILYQPGCLLSFVSLEVAGNGVIIAVWSGSIKRLLKKVQMPQPRRSAGWQAMIGNLLPIASACTAVLMQWVFL